MGDVRGGRGDRRVVLRSYRYDRQRTKRFDVFVTTREGDLGYDVTDTV